jgi:hypothetical protein
MRNAYRILVGKAGERPLRRQIHRRESTDLRGVEWTRFDWLR